MIHNESLKCIFKCSLCKGLILGEFIQYGTKGTVEHNPLVIENGLKNKNCWEILPLVNVVKSEENEI